MIEIAANIAAVRETIAKAAARSNRSVDAITLVAVSKTMPIDYIRAALAEGIRDFAENRVEEAAQKITAFAESRPHWHMIGHIQSRKVKEIVPLFDVVHSVERLKIAQKLSEQAQAVGKIMPIFLEINISGEEAKDGFAAVDWQKKPETKSKLWDEIAEIAALPALELRGLMTMAPYVDEAEASRPVFASLAMLREAIRQDLKLVLPDLSMGMTNDYTVAIEEGATIVRIGRAIFGERPVQ